MARMQHYDTASARADRYFDIDRLIRLGIGYLENAYLEEDGLFPFATVRTKGSLQNVGLSVRYTAIAVMGLYRARECGLGVALDLDRILAQLVDRLPGIINIGDLGLIAWAIAVGNREHGEEILTAIEQYGEFYVRKGTRSYASLELEWLLIGLCYLYPKWHQKERIERLIMRCHEKLIRNYHPQTGLFRFCSSDDNLTIMQRLKKNLSYFAEQIYGVYALVSYYELTRDTLSLTQAKRIAELLCAFQGPEGQWCWTYDVETGEVVESYPVYSVHQDGMAPMALMKLSRIGGCDYRSAVIRGVDWLFGKNEFRMSMINWQQQVVWRSIRKRGWLKCASNVKKMLLLLKFPLPIQSGPVQTASGLEIDYECRPYHMGWMLYALLGYHQELGS
jgi:hypothetical protein